MTVHHRVTHMVRPGRLSLASDETGNISKVQVKHNKVEMRDCHHMQMVGFASGLPIGTDILANSIGGDMSSGVIVASNHKTHRPKNLQTGEVCIYDCGATQQSILLKADGTIVLTGFHKVVMTADTEIDITAPTVKVTGNLQVTGSIIAGYGTGDAVTVQQHRHGTGTAAAGTSIPTAGT
jgi:phage gp45-like